MDSRSQSKAMTPEIKTKILILSDTHGMLNANLFRESADVAIHCGDLTEESKLDEFRAALQLLHNIDAPIKLIIAGNHDFTLDEPVFRKKAEDALKHSSQELISKVYGNYGEARSLLATAKEQGVHFLEEGTHRFVLANGAILRVYASPFTPSLGDWGFQYPPDKGHQFEIPKGIDVAITHGPPRGILDRTDGRERAGCPHLFAAVAQSKPRIHCFGHIHEAWGAKLVAWRKGRLSEEPSHLNAIDNDKSRVVEMLSTLQRQKFEDDEMTRCKELKASKYTQQGFCGAQICRETGECNEQTLFVNAAIEARDEGPHQLPWLVEMDLPEADADTENEVSMVEASRVTSDREKAQKVVVKEEEEGGGQEGEQEGEEGEQGSGISASEETEERESAATTPEVMQKEDLGSVSVITTTGTTRKRARSPSMGGFLPPKRFLR